MATVARLVGDIAVAEDAVQDACVAALRQWPRDGVPGNPSSWLISTAHHKALDWLRREARRSDKEQDAIREAAPHRGLADDAELGADELALIFTCCHPALDPAVRVPLTLRSVCGLSTAQIAAVFVLPEATVAQRLVRAKRKIRQAGIPLRAPMPDALPRRLPDVLQVVYLMFTEGHRASRGSELVSGTLCEEAIGLARRLRALMPREPEIDGLLALLLLTDARRSARSDSAGAIVVLAQQDRSLWDAEMISAGLALLESALAQRRPGPYQLEAAIAACHASAPDLESTDWPQIARLYQRLAEYRPDPVVAANRAVATAMTEGPAAGLALLSELVDQPAISGWAPFHLARAALLEQLGCREAALAAYRAAAERSRAEPEQRLIAERITALQRSV